MLNQKQQKIYNLIKEGKNVFITSPAGTGKTFLLKYISEAMETKKIAITSTTGVSALLINGTTLHSYLGIGLGIETVENLVRMIYKKQKQKNWDIDILIIDEVSMLSANLFDKLNLIAQIIKNNKKPFGGIQLILSGDLLQLPIIQKEDVEEQFIINANCWKECVDIIATLDVIVRQKDEHFQNVLLKLRKAIIDNDVISLLDSRINQKPPTNIKPTKLFCLKKYVEEINRKELLKLQKQKFPMIQFNGVFKKNKNINDQLFNTIKTNFIKNSTTQENLILCQNAQVMLTFNIDIENSLVNGSRGVIQGFTKDLLPIVLFKNNIVKIISSQKWSLISNRKEAGTFEQIPLRIAYALTIHSCQGLTMDCVEIDLADAFEYGQVYTAISRTKDINSLYIKNIDYKKIKAHPQALEFYQLI